MAHAVATTRPLRIAVLVAGDPIITDELEVGQAIGTGYDLIAEEDESAYVAALPVELFPPLPDSGWLEAGDIYTHGGGCVMVRQSHNRTEHDPADVPALFVVHRPDSLGLDWIAGETVAVGTIRIYDGTTYQCLQGHVTQADWTPPAVPALWEVYSEEPPVEEPAPWVQPTGAHDAYQIGDLVTFEGAVYRSLINANVWSPAVYPAGWELVP